MQLSKWSDQQLNSLARIYIKHKRFGKSAAVHNEIANRIEVNLTKHLQMLLDELDHSNVRAMTSTQKSKHAA